MDCVLASLDVAHGCGGVLALLHSMSGDEALLDRIWFLRGVDGLHLCSGWWDGGQVCTRLLEGEHMLEGGCGGDSCAGQHLVLWNGQPVAQCCK